MMKLKKGAEWALTIFAMLMFVVLVMVNEVYSIPLYLGCWFITGLCLYVLKRYGKGVALGKDEEV